MSKRIRERSQLQEKRAAKDIGGRTVAGSGAAKFSGGGDVRKQGEIRVECKFTGKEHYDLKLSDLKKIKLQALKGGLERPVMQLEFLVTVHATIQLAIYPDLPNGSLHQLATTSNKQIRLHRQEILKSLVDSIHGTQVTFLEGPRSIPHTFTIDHWSSYLMRLEEEDEC